MKRMDNMEMSGMEEFVVPQSLFEALEDIDYDKTHNYGSMESSSSILDYELDISSDTMASFMEMEQVQEVDMFPVSKMVVPVIPRPSVIMKPTKKPAPEPTPSLSDILTSCGIEYDLVESDAASSVASPSSLHSDMEKTQELIDELEDFFMKTEGAPTVVDDQEMKMVIPEPILESNNNNNLTLGDLEQAVTTNMTTEDGQNVIIIIAPSSPSESIVSSASVQEPTSPGYCPDTDPEWSPSPASLASPPSRTKPRKKYARTKAPKAPMGPYPTDKKERKKAQNRTAAFRYREKMKSHQDNVEEELEELEEKNNNLKEKLTEMETEFKYLKKLMIEAGLGKYAAAVKY